MCATWIRRGYLDWAVLTVPGVRRVEAMGFLATLRSHSGFIPCTLLELPWRVDVTANAAAAVMTAGQSSGPLQSHV